MVIRRIVNDARGQMKVQQMAFMLVGLTLFFVLVGLFVLSFAFSGLKESKELLDEQEATLLASRLSNSPEFTCGSAFGTDKVNCIDMDKVRALKTKADEYKGFWGAEGIEILRIYPSSEGECTESSYPDCQILKVLESGSPGIDKSSFVSLCRKENFGGRVENKCEIGKLVVRVSDE